MSIYILQYQPNLVPSAAAAFPISKRQEALGTRFISTYKYSRITCLCFSVVLAERLLVLLKLRLTHKKSKEFFHKYLYSSFELK